jgi:hypothetical protein
MSIGWGDDIVKSIYIFFFSKNEDDGLNPEVDSEGKLFSTFAFKACFRPVEPAFPAASIPSRIPACPATEREFHLGCPRFICFRVAGGEVCQKSVKNISLANPGR